jgi:hypothetical protein
MTRTDTRGSETASATHAESSRSGKPLARVGIWRSPRTPKLQHLARRGRRWRVGVRPARRNFKIWGAAGEGAGLALTTHSSPRTARRNFKIWGAAGEGGALTFATHAETSRSGRGEAGRRRGGGEAGRRRGGAEAGRRRGGGGAEARWGVCVRHACRNGVARRATLGRRGPAAEGAGGVARVATGGLGHSFSLLGRILDSMGGRGVRRCFGKGSGLSRKWGVRGRRGRKGAVG